MSTDSQSTVLTPVYGALYLASRQDANDKVVWDLCAPSAAGPRFLSEQLGAAKVRAFGIADDSDESVTCDFSSVIDALNAALSDESVDSPELIIGFDLLAQVEKPELVLEALAQHAQRGVPIVLSAANDWLVFGRGSDFLPNRNSFEFDEFRELVERHLGEASWALVSPALGATLYPLEDGRRVVGSSDPAGLLGAVESDPLAPISTTTCSAYVASINTTLNTSSFLQAKAPGGTQDQLPAAPLRQRLGGHSPHLRLVVDVRGWAYDNIADNLESGFDGRYTVDRTYVGDHPGRPGDLLADIFRDPLPDHVHFFWREDWFGLIQAPSRLEIFARKLELSAQDAALRLSKPAVTIGVYDHLYSSSDELAERDWLFALSDGYSVSSNRLEELYSEQLSVKPLAVTPDGVNIDMFRPVGTERFEPGSTGPLVVGWVGNSKWHKSETADPKGVSTILWPAIEQLHSQGYAVVADFADASEAKRDRSEMPDYYNSIDVLVCSSLHEGTPNPVLEAMACGVPIISTDVGLVRDVCGPLQSELILDERSPGAMAAMLERLILEEDLSMSLSIENRKRMEEWSWRHHLPEWLRLFRRASIAHEFKQPERYAMCLQSIRKQQEIERLRSSD